ncbi:E3 ubiquitin-protein ligase HAKAI homolog [Impatiens glandulifera]|uniref:E3 ubiquitin-protein ligase HAKAI homolog n=1 Tax=Impatiens glandulifera TaxID=253017 RepID=UPI001FB14E4C|nr:E3 ubiquitin-protein ligase HAKAI homolog [Impatiens glandulifera]
MTIRPPTTIWPPTTIQAPDDGKKQANILSWRQDIALEDMTIAKTIAKSLGPPPAALLVKNVGRRSNGERLHFCLNCDFPIAAYGRLIPCTHVFCLSCSESTKNCFVCEESIEIVETIKRTDDLFVCSSPLCLKSFVIKDKFESHVRESHGNVLKPSRENENGNGSLDAMKQKSPAAAAAVSSESATVIDLLPPPKPAAAAASASGLDSKLVMGPPPPRAAPAAAASGLDSKLVMGPPPPKAVPFSSPIPVTKIHDREDQCHRPLPRDPPYPIPMMQQQQQHQQQQQPRPFFRPIGCPPIQQSHPVLHPAPAPPPPHNFFVPIAPPPQIIYGGPPYDMGRLGLGSHDNRPSILGFPPNMQPLHPPRGVFPLQGPMIHPPHQGGGGAGRGEWGNNNDGRGLGRWNN